MTKRGGAKRPYKQIGRKPVYKCYKEFLRGRALAGTGHTADGSMRNGAVSPTSDDMMSRNLYYGYKFD